MSLGPGKYDHLLTQARKAAKAAGAILIIIDGEHGSSFCVQGTPELTARLPALLKHMAGDIGKHIANDAGHVSAAERKAN